MRSLIQVILTMFVIAFAQSGGANEMDERVRKFLDERQNSWRDLNVPAQDGQIMHDLIIEKGYQQALEIGTSTGHSTIWIAWALSKTGGKLITIEIDERRHNQARENLKAAGLEGYVKFILGNAHDLVPEQSGPFDFVFSDADKNWYVQYFKDVYPKLTDDACLAAHNVRKSSWRGWMKNYVDYIEEIPDMTTKYYEDGPGMSITCKK